MARSTPKLVLSTVFLSTAAAILVAQDSPCAPQCGNVLSSTSGADVLCSPDGAATSAGIVYQNCIQCELLSGFSSSKDGTDLQWLLYNSRWSLAWCLYGDLGNQEPLSDLEVCTTSRACGSLQDSVEFANLSTTAGPYDYCSSWDTEFASKCESCLSTVNDGVYLSNYVLMLDAACAQQPAANGTLYVAGSPFSSTPMTITTPTPPNPYLNLDNGPITLGGKVGIAVGGVIFLLALVGFCIVCNGRRRRRRFLHKLEMQHKDQGWPHPAPAASKKGGILGGKSIMPQRAEVNDTPLSQKPLRGWDDSPQSATTTSEQQFGRYYSPYSSQYNSPINGNDGSGRMQQWPTFPSTFGGHNASLGEAAGSSQSPIAYPSAAQERAQHSQSQYPHDGGHLMDASSPQQARGQQPIDFGLALGGSQSSSRSQPSHGEIVGKENESPDSYEMHDVSQTGSSSNSSTAVAGHSGATYGHTRQSSSFAARMARAQPQHQQQAPVLQHPGYGRYSPEKMGLPRRTSGLTEEDARRGDAL